MYPDRAGRHDWIEEPVNFLELLRAGHGDYVIRRRRGLYARPIVPGLAAPAHRLGVGARTRIEGVPGLLTDAVIVTTPVQRRPSRALLDAERLIHSLIGFTAHNALERIRARVWWFARCVLDTTEFVTLDRLRHASC